MAIFGWKINNTKASYSCDLAVFIATQFYFVLFEKKKLKQYDSVMFYYMAANYKCNRWETLSQGPR